MMEKVFRCKPSFKVVPDRWSDRNHPSPVKSGQITKSKQIILSG
ncbi:hypothetical protein [Leptolyngbya ohadii]|nr:hypothetical protein [Leptolyngbya ohadii]